MKKYFPLLVVMLTIGFVTIEPAFAAEVTDSVTGVLQRIVNLITGTWGTLLAVIAVAGTGISWALFGLDLRKALSIIAGIILIFGAAQIVAMFQGK